MARANLNKSVWLVTNTTAASKYTDQNQHQISLHKISNKKFCSRNNFYSVFYVLSSKRKFRSNRKFFEISFLKIYFIY